MILEMNGFATTTARNEKDLHYAMKKQLPDLLLMDINVDGADGREICQLIKTTEHTSHIPVVLMSSSANKLETFRKYQADDFLEKPFNLKDLVAKLRFHLAARVN